MITAIAVCVATIACSAGPAMAAEATPTETASLCDAPLSRALTQVSETPLEKGLTASDELVCSSTEVVDAGDESGADALGPIRVIVKIWVTRDGRVRIVIRIIRL